MRAVGYLRVSSKGQRDRQTIEAQTAAIPAFVERNGWLLSAPIGTYVDDGQSAKYGNLAARTALHRLMADAAAGLFDVVVVVDLDRLTRSEDLTERGAVLGAFQRAGVRVAIVNTGQDLDLSTSQGDLLAGFAAYFAAEENRKRSARAKNGHALAVSRGRKPSGRTPYGLTYDRETKEIAIRDDEGDVVREMFARCLDGWSTGEIGDELSSRGIRRRLGGLWRREKVWRVLTSAIYRGEWIVNVRTGASISVPAIVDSETWYAVQAKLAAAGKRGLVRTRSVYLLEGLCVCERCGARIGVHSASRRTPRSYAEPSRYVCSHRRRPPYGTPRCDLPIHRSSEIDDRLWSALVGLLSRDDLLEQALAVDGHDAERDVWERDVTDAERRIARLVEVETGLLARHRRGQVSSAALDVELAAIARERSALSRQADTARRALASASSAHGRTSALAAALDDARALLSAATPLARQHVLRALLRPGSVVLGDSGLVATVALAAGQTHGSGCRSKHEAGDSARVTSVEFRLVA